MKERHLLLKCQILHLLHLQIRKLLSYYLIDSSMTVCCSVIFLDSVQKTPKWNFWKFLVDTDGRVVRFWQADESMESVREEARALVREIILKKRVEL